MVVAVGSVVTAGVSVTGLDVAAAVVVAAAFEAAWDLASASCSCFSLLRSSASSEFCRLISLSFLVLISSRSPNRDLSSLASCSLLVSASRTLANSALVAALPESPARPLPARSPASWLALPSRGGTRARRSSLDGLVAELPAGRLVAAGVVSATRVGARVWLELLRHSSIWARTAAAASRADSPLATSAAEGMRNTAPRFSALMLSSKMRLDCS